MSLKLILIFMISASALGVALESERKDGSEPRRPQKGKEDEKVGKEVTRSSSSSKPNRDGSGTSSRQSGWGYDAACTSIGGICQLSRYICQGRYLRNKCAGPRVRRCCLPGPGAWRPLCASHHQNRIRGCDRFGCGAFNSERAGSTHKAVDVVCDDYAAINAPFSGTLGGPVSRRQGDAVHYDGVKLYNSESCVKIFNIRPYRYVGHISKGEAMGYLLPLQERFSGITSHLELQMCDHSNPTPFI
nr:leukocyte cell-derived chemotaxin-2-like [Paramormyrops kingsleyae]XP_023659379.1 leukocyte cell-derived chemotaxin-2-like [Paramormyrops kingsleyae]